MGAHSPPPPEGKIERGEEGRKFVHQNETAADLVEAVPISYHYIFRQSLGSCRYICKHVLLAVLKPLANVAPPHPFSSVHGTFYSFYTDQLPFKRWIYDLYAYSSLNGIYLTRPQN